MDKDKVTQKLEEVLNRIKKELSDPELEISHYQIYFLHKGGEFSGDGWCNRVLAGYIIDHIAHLINSPDKYKDKYIKGKGDYRIKIDD